MRSATLLSLTALLALGGCADGPAKDGGVGPGLDIGEEVPELGKAVFSPAEDRNAKEDSFLARKGLPISVDEGPTQVWPVDNAWADTDTPAARKAGMAWPANSELSWDQKYARWVESMPRIDGHSYGQTFKLITPYGKRLPGPALECAEAALFLRAAFASWYHLPFFVQASDRDGRIYLGHFGFLRADGSRYRGTPRFKTAYRDYSAQADSWESDGWPKDTKLRGRRLGGSQDDFQPFIADGAHAGTYFDEAFLNKRTGYFMIYLLSYFGSINLASPSNMYNLKPEATRAGDALVKRYSAEGIGHVYVVKHSERTEDSFELELMSGSMPRRQPKWEDAGQSMLALTAEEGGGAEESWDGVPYATLGGGIKRWRTPIVVSGRWTNIVPAEDRGAFVDAADQAAIGARPAHFGEILGTLSPEEKRDILLDSVQAQRDHLRLYPASCSARTRREEAFAKLYPHMATEFGLSKAQVDARYRMLEDYALPEMVYNKSKTCCWNQSTAAMFDIIMQKAYADIEDPAAGECRAPTGFYARNGDYEIFKAYAESLGRGAEWRAWSEDEGCPQRNVENDLEAAHDWSPWCEVAETVLSGGGEAPADGDALEPNDTRAQASAVGAGEQRLTLCEGDEDWFAITSAGGALDITVSFRNSDNDIDLRLMNTSAERLATSAGTEDSEHIQQTLPAGTYYLRVFPYSHKGGCNAYALTIGVDGAAPDGAAGDDDAYEPNDSQAAAATLTEGSHEAASCGGNIDWFGFDLAAGRSLSVRVAFTHADGDLDISLHKGGARLQVAQSSTDDEIIEGAFDAGHYDLRVYPYGDHAACQPYTVDLTL